MNIAGKQLTKQTMLKIVAIATVGLVVLGVGAYVFLIQKERAEFAKAEKEIDALYAQIVEKVGKPNQEKKEKTCGYASRVIGKGPRGCSVSFYVLYENKNLVQANEIVRNVSQILNIKPSRYTMSEFGGGEYTYEFSKVGDRVVDQTLESVLSVNFSKGCSIELVHPGVGSGYDKFETSAKENVLVGLVCGGSAMMEYFPVKE